MCTARADVQAKNSSSVPKVMLNGIEIMTFVYSNTSYNTLFLYDKGFVMICGMNSSLSV